MELSNVRTRFAPSPTGLLHFGNANTAVFNWLLARRYGGTVVLRIEDTDRERSTKEFYEGLLFDLKWLGIDWDEGPDVGGPHGAYRQSERDELYQNAIQQLMEKGAAYRCYCSREQLDEDRKKQQAEKLPFQYAGRCRNLTPDDWARLDAEGKPFTIRFRTPDDQQLVMHDLIRGDIVFQSHEIDDFIFVRGNGEPTFLLTNAVDDALMRITHVVRGEDHISNTPKQILINQALGHNVPQYLHTAIILGEDKTKLSKRHGAVNVSQFRALGYIPEAMTNYLAFLGWNPKDDREFFSLDELKKEYSIEAMSKNPSVFDYKRLHFLNEYWMQKIDRDKAIDICADYLVKTGTLTKESATSDRDYIAKVFELLAERVKLVNDIVDVGGFFFKEIEEYDPKDARKFFPPEQAPILRTFADTLSALNPFTRESIETGVHEIMEKNELNKKQVFQPLRLAMVGKTIGPGLFEMIELLGKEKAVARLLRAAQFIESNP